MAALRPSRLAAIVALALLAPAAAAAAPSPAVLAALAAPQPLPDVAQGRADAPVTIIEYASVTCSHCAAFHRDAWPATKGKYVDAGRVKFVLREFPLDPLSVGAFMVARCAGERRNAVIDRLLDDQAEWASTDNPLLHLKEQLEAAGMSQADFKACLKNQALFDKVKAMHEAAAARPNVKSTPTFFVDGVELTGEHALDKLDEILGNRGK